MRTVRATGSVLEELGRRADRPAVAAGLVAASAVAFSAVWFAVVVLDGNAFVPSLFLAAVADALAVTYVVWRLAIPDGTWGYRQGLTAGLLVGFGSHLTIGFAWILALVATGTDVGGLGSVTRAVSAGLFLGAVSLPTTLDVPVLLRLGIALGLTHARRRATTAGSAG